jgi:MFS family permease
VAASCMVLYGYDASVFNALQNSKHWNAYFNHPGPNIIGAINTSYTVGAVVAGFFMGGPLADYAGRRMGMAVGAALVIVATFMQTFAPRGNIGVFIAGRVVIGLGQGLALSEYCMATTRLLSLTVLQPLAQSTSAKWHHQRFEEKSCPFGRCSTAWGPSSPTG